MIVQRQELMANPGQVYHKLFVNGPFGVGKTYFAMTYPKWAYAMIEPNGITTALVPKNRALLDNMVHYESFVPTVGEDLKVTKERLSKYLLQVREDAKAGLVQTFIFDNISHYAENQWMYMEQYEKGFHTTNTGAVNTLSMYGALGRYLWKFTVMELVSLPCHVIVNCHEMEEEESQQTAQGEKRVKTGRVIPNILGGFRKDAPGLFNACLYLERQQVGTGYKFRALCQATSQRPHAKNNLGLPQYVENISYETIMKEMGGEVTHGNSQGVPAHA